MKWCVTAGRSKSGIRENPYRDAVKPNGENSRDRVLSHHEIALMWRAVEGEGGQWAALYRLILLTGVRRCEASAALKVEIENELWTIPGDRTKNSRVHLLSLPPLAMEQVSAAVALSGKSDFLFPTSKIKTPITGFTRVHDRILAKMTELNGGVAVERWTLHDLRRTSRTEWSRLKIDHFVAESLLNHTLAGLHATYDRYNRFDEKRDALALWAKHVAEIVN